MKNIWANLGDQIKSLTDTATEKAGVITRAAAAKAEELSKVGKLKMEIYQLRREQGRLYADLGQIAYRTLEGRSEGTLESQPNVEELRHQISQLEAKIKEKEDVVERISRVEEPIPTAAAPKEKITQKKETPTAKPEKEEAASKKKAPARKPVTKKTGSSEKKTSSRK